MARILHWLKKPVLAAAFALGMSGVTTPAHAFLDSEKAWNDLLQFAVRQINAPGEFEIELGNVTKPEEGFALISTLRIRDSDGIWLDAKGLLVDWNPTSLLRGRFSFETLSADEINVLRAPIGRGDPPADEAQIDFAWPRPPVSMVVETMLIKRMVIAGGLLPQDIEARIEGRFFDQGDVQETTLGVKRLDRPGDTIDLGTRIDFDDMDISFSLEANEAPGGLVSELAGLPETEALEITAAASGDPSSLPFTLYADIGQIGVADGSGIAQWKDKTAVTFDGEVQPGAKTAGRWRDALGDAAKIKLDAEQTAEGAYRLNAFQIDSDAFNLDGVGLVDLEANLIDVDVDWTAKDVGALNAVIAPSQVSALNGSAKAKGALNAPKVDVTAIVRDLKTASGSADAIDLVIDSAPNTDPNSKVQEFSFVAKATGLDLTDPALQGALGPTPTFEGNGAFYGSENRVAVETISLSAASLDLEGNAQYDLSAGALNAELSGEAMALGPFLRAAGLPIDGAANLALKIQNLTATSVERLFLNAQLSNLSSEDATYAAVIGQDAVLEALLVESDPGVVKIERGFFESATLRTEAAGQFSVEADSVDLALDWRLKDAERIAPVIAPAELGGGAGTAVLKGTLSEPKIDIDAALTEVAYPGYGAERVEASGTVQYRKDRRAPFSMATNLQGFRADDPTLAALVGATPAINATGIFDTATSLLTLEDADASVAAGNLGLQGNVHLAKQTIDASYELTSRDLAVIGSSQGVEMSGTIDAEGSVNGAWTAPLISTRADVRDLQLYGYSVEALDLDLKTDPDEGGTVPFTLDLAATNPSLQDPELDALIGASPRISAKGTFNAKAKKVDLESFSAALNQITATAAGQVDALNKSLDVTFDFDAQKLEGIGALVGADMAGTLKAKGSASGSFFAPEVNATLDGSALRYDDYSVGVITGRVDIKQSLVGYAPFDVDLTASDVSLGDPALNDLIGPRAKIRARGAYNQLAKGLRLDAAEFDTAAAKGTASGSVDLSEQTVDMTYDVDIASLDPIGEVAGIALGGSAKAKGKVSGPFDAPVIDTTLEGRDLRYEQYRVAAIDGRIDVKQAESGFAPFDIDVTASGVDLGDPALTDLIGNTAKLRATGGFDQSKRLVRLDELDIDAALAKASAKGSIDLDDQSLDVDYDLTAASLARLQSVLGTEVAGSLAAKGSVVGRFAAPTLTTEIDGRGLRYGVYQIGKIDGDVSLKRNTDGPSPFEIDIVASDLDLADPGLNKALGKTAKIAAVGDFDQAAQSLNLTNAEVTTDAATINAKGDVDLSAQTLDVAFDLDASDLSPISVLAGSELSGSMKAEGRASGPFTAPEVDVTLVGRDLRYASYAVASLDGSVRVEQDDDGFAPFAIDLKASGFDLGDPKLSSALGSTASITAEGAFSQADKVLELDSLSATTDAAKVSASGAVDLAAGSIDLRYDLDARTLAPFSPLAGTDLGGAFKANGSINGPFTAPAVATSVSGTSLRYGQYTVAGLDGRVDIPASTGGFAPFEIDVSANGISLGDPAFDSLIGDTASLRASGQIDQSRRIARIESAQLATRGLSARASGTVNLDAATLDLTFSVDAADLSPATALVGKPVGGAFKATGSARGAFASPIVNLDATGIGLYFGSYSVGQLDLNVTMDSISNGLAPFAVDARLYGPRLGDPALDAIIGENVTLVSRGVIDQETQRVRIDDATLRGGFGAARIAGIIDLPARELDLGYSAHLPRLDLFQAIANRPLSGDVRADGRVSGAFSDPSTSGILVGTGLQVDSYDVTSVTVRYDIASLVSGPAGSVSLDGQTPNGPVTASTRFNLSGGALRIESLQVDGLGLNLAGSFRSLPGGLYQGDVTLQATNLSQLGNFIGQDIAGEANGTVRLDGQNGEQFAAVDVTVTNFRYAQNGAVIASAQIADIRGTANDAFGADPVVDGTLYISQAEVQGIPVQQLEVAARGPLSALNTRIVGAGGPTGSDKLETTAILNLVKFPRGATFYTFAASYQGVQLASASQFSIREISGGGWRAEGLDLRLDDGEIVGSGEYSSTGIVANLRFRNVPLRLTQLSGVDLIQSGRLFGEMMIDTRAAPTGSFALRANSVRLKGAQLDEPFEIAVDGTLDGEALNIEAGMNSRIINQPLRAKARIPLMQSAGVPFPVPDQNAPFSASVDWEGDVSEFWAFVPAPDHVLSGPVVINGRAGGTLAAPQLTGGLVLTNGRYQNLEFGTLLDQLNAKADFTQDGRVAFDMTATDGVSGQVTARGSYTVASGAIDAGVTLTSAAVVRRDDATVIISGEVTATGAGDNADIAVRGGFRTDFVELRLIGGFGGGVVVVDAIPVGETAPRYEEPSTSAKPQRISLDVTLDFPQQVFVRGRGLDSEWGGQIRATGYASDPKVNGLIEKRRGWLDLLGKQFELSIGEVRFSGPVDPFIRVRLQRQDNDILGWVDIVGPSSDIELEFGSIPALPPDEVLPRLLFGRSKQSLSGLEAAQLAAGVATLLSGKASALDEVRGALGVDVLRVEGTALATGKYIAEDVFVGAKQDLETGQTSAVVEIEIFDNFEIEGEFGAEEAEASANWKLDY